MLKIFSFVLVMASLVSSANAALLASWSFTDSSQAGVATSGNLIAGDQDGNFSGNAGGYASASVSTTASGASLVRTAVFFLKAADLASASIERFTFDALRGTGANPPVATGTRATRVSVVADVGTGSADVGGFVLGSNVSGLTVSPDSNSNLTASYTEYEGVFSTPVSLAGGDVLRLTVTYTGTAGTTTASTVLRLDDMQIFGSAVPEPTSMAVFGLLGAGVIARRIRRKA